MGHQGEPSNTSRTITAVCMLLALAAAAWVIHPMWSVQRVADDLIYWRFAQVGGDLPGARTRPVSTWGLVWMFKYLPLWACQALRVMHHGLNAWLVAMLGRRSLQLPTPYAGLAGLCFFVWGSQGEVFWFSALHDIAATTFVLVALWLCTHSLTCTRACLLAGAAALAYLSKEAAWPLPAILLAWPQPRHRLGRTQCTWALVALGTLALCLATRWLWAGHMHSESDPHIYAHISVQQMARAWPKLLIRAFIPGSVNLQHWVPLWRGHAVQLMACGAFVAAVGLGKLRGQLGRLWNDAPAARLVVCFVVALTPAVQLSVSLENGENARYLSLATVFTTLLAGWVVSKLAMQQRFAVVGAAVVIAWQGVALHRLGTFWIEAGNMNAAYETSLRQLLHETRLPEPVYVACVPDNFRGAYASRNVSAEVAAALTPPQHVEVLALQYVKERPQKCLWSLHDNSLQLHSPERDFTHPDLTNQGEVNVGPFKLQAAEARANELLIVSRHGQDLAIYGDTGFKIITF